MQQSNVIFGALLIAFIVYITARGELATYIQLLRGGGAQAGAAGGGTQSASSGSSDFDQGLKAATTAAQLAVFL